MSDTEVYNDTPDEIEVEVSYEVTETRTATAKISRTDFENWLDGLPEEDGDLKYYVNYTSIPSDSLWTDIGPVRVSKIVDIKRRGAGND